MQLSDFLHQYVIPRLDRLELFAQLDPKQRGGQKPRIEMTCPSCKAPGRTAWIYDDGEQIYCNREGQTCYNASIVHYLNNGTYPSGPAYREFVDKLASRVGLQLPARDDNPEALARYEKLRIRAQSLEQFFAACRQEVFSNQTALAWWQGRGFEDLQETELGWTPRDLKPFGALLTDDPDPEQIQRTSYAWRDRAVGPIRDRHGRLVGMWGRRTDGEKKAKYINTASTPFEQIGAAGLDVALKNGGQKCLILQEGMIDVWTGRRFDIKNIGAMGSTGAVFSPERWKLLADFGVELTVLFCDNDPAGQASLQKALSNSRQAPYSPEIAVVPRGAIPADCKDPDEILRRHGAGAFISAVTAAEHALSVDARILASSFDLNTQGGRAAYWNVCIDFEKKLPDHRFLVPIRQFFWPAVEELSGVDMDFVLDHLEAEKNKSARAQAEKSLRDAITEAQEAILGGNLPHTQEVLSAGVERAQKALSRDLVKPALTVKQDLRQYLTSLRREARNPYLGYMQETIPELNEAIMGFRGLTLLSGKSGDGKTLLAGQVAVEMLEKHPELCCLFVSFDMRKIKLYDRWITLLSGLPWVAVKRGSGLQGDGHTSGDWDQIERGYLRLEKVASRLKVLDRENFPNCSTASIIREITDLKKETGSKDCLLVFDFLQRFPVPEHVESDPDDWRIDQFRYITDRFNDAPTIVLSQNRKAVDDPDSNDNVKGSVEIIASCDTVLIVRPATNDELLDSYTMSEGRPVVKHIDVLGDEEGKTAAKRDKLAKRIRDALAKIGKASIVLRVSKGRDGCKRVSLPLTNYFDLCHIKPGVN